MGEKDHLPTPEESSKKRNRDLKKVTSTAYIGNPPNLTRGIDSVGIVARTTGEVRDTDFPILFDIDDKTQNYLVDDSTTNLTYTIDLSKQDAHYHRLIIDDEDVDTDSITNIDVVFENLAINKELQFTIEFIKNPSMTSTPTITFSPTLEGALAQPSPFPDDADVWYFLISARTLPDDTTRFELLNFGTGSGGGNTFPILYPEETIGSIGGPTQNINISGSNGQFKEMTLTGNVDLTFSNFPSSTVLEEFWILVNQDNTGGWTLTSTGSTLKNAGTLNSLLDKAANAQTLFHFVTGDAGTTIHANLVDLTASGGGFSGNLSDLVIDVNKDWNEKTIINLAGLDLFTTVANSLTNASIVSFVANTGTARGQIGRSDFFGTAQGLAMNIPDNDNIVFSVDTVQKVLIDSTAELITFEYALNMMGNEITNVGYLESDTPDRPGDGFIRMANTDKIRIRNSGNSDDLIIGASETPATNAMEFTAASAVQLTIGTLAIDVHSNNIINTGDITKAPGAANIGESAEGYTDIFAKYFRPVGAAATTKDGYTLVGDNRHLISYDSGSVDGGFGIYEDGIEKFLFEVRFGDVHILNIGSSDVFTAGEEYRIQMGENSNSSARIFFIEGTGKDLNLDRAGGGIDQGVQVLVNGLSAQRWLSQEMKFFKDLNINSQPIFNTRLIKADTSALATIGETVTGNGGFDMYLKDKMYWESDPDTYIQFDSAGIHIVSDDGMSIVATGVGDSFTIASVPPVHMFVTNGTGFSVYVAGSIKWQTQDNFNVSYQELTMTGNKIVDLLDPTADQDAATKKYVDDNSSGGGGGSGSDAFAQVVKTFSLPVVNNSTTLVKDTELKFTPNANKVYYIECNLKCFSDSPADIKFALNLPAGATYQLSSTVNGANFSSPAVASELETLAFDTTSGDPTSAVFYAIVEVGSTATEISLAFAQNTANGSNTFVARGSMMRVYEEGTSSGGGGGGFSDIINATLSTNMQFGEQIGNRYYGESLYDNAIDITITDTSEPAGFTFTHTILSGDFPTGISGMTFNSFFAIQSVQLRNDDTVTRSISVKWFVNGVDIGFFTRSVNAGEYYYGIRGEPGFPPNNYEVVAGDIVQIKCWADAATTNDVILTKTAIWTAPKKMTVNSGAHVAILRDLDDVLNMAPKIAGQLGTTQTENSQAGTDLYINTDLAQSPIFGGTLTIDIGGGMFLGSAQFATANGNSVDRMWIPKTYPMGAYVLDT